MNNIARLLVVSVFLLFPYKANALDYVQSHGGGSSVSDTAYDATTWNGVTDVAPSKNAVRDKIESMGTDGGFSECKTITIPSDADTFFFWIAKQAITATKITGIAFGGTSVVVDVQECTSAGASCANIQTASLTVDTDGANTTSFSDSAIASGAVLKIDIGVVTGAVTQVMVCLEGN